MVTERIDGEPTLLVVGGGPAGFTAALQACELGADIIKADPTDDVSIYHKVIQTAAGIPVLVRGGGRATDAAR